MYGLEALSLPAHRDRCETSKLYTDTAKRKDSNTRAPAMQHRHFAFIARTIAGLTPKGNTRSIAANAFANALADANPNFDRARFLNACYPDE